MDSTPKLGLPLRTDRYPSIGKFLEEAFKVLDDKVGTGNGGGGGADGEDGKSAYQIAVDNGFVGNVTAWLASLKGVKGDDGEDGTDGVGTDGTDGVDGKSAYQVAVDNGFVGDVTAWLASLKGVKGDDGEDGSPGGGGGSPEVILHTAAPGDYSFILTDAHKIVLVSNDGAVEPVVTVPHSSTANFPYAANGATTVIYLINLGDEDLSLEPAEDVNLIMLPNYMGKVGRRGFVRLTKVNTNDWHVDGDLEFAA